MSTSERHYGDGPSRPIPVWNGILDHQATIGEAVWVYLWCLDKITDEPGGIGRVLGGAPVKIERISRELHRSQRSVKRDLRRLRSRYLQLRRTPYGYAIGVLNSQKFGIWRQAKSGPSLLEREAISGTRDRPKLVKREAIYGTNKEDAAVDAAKNAAAASGASPRSEDLVWGFLQISPCGPPSFRSLLENRWASKNGQRASVLIGETVDAWEAAESAKLRAPQLFHALSELRNGEKNNKAQTDTADPIHALTPEEIPA